MHTVRDLFFRCAMFVGVIIVGLIVLSLLGVHAPIIDQFRQIVLQLLGKAM